MRPHHEPERHRRQAGMFDFRAWLLGSVIAVGALAGCSSEPPPPSSPADLMQPVTVDYRSGADDLPTHEIQKGKIVYLNVVSDRAGTVRVGGYDVARPVAAGQGTLLVFSADRAGDFDVLLDSPGRSDRMAGLEIDD